MYLDGKIGISGSQNSLQRVSQYMAMLDQAMEQVMCLLSLILVLRVRLLDLVLCVCRALWSASSRQETILKFSMKMTRASLEASEEWTATLNPRP